ncbi:hypothetical protein OSJ57_15260 [Sphingomonas sp. HH69]
MPAFERAISTRHFRPFVREGIAVARKQPDPNFSGLAIEHGDFSRCFMPWLRADIARAVNRTK